MGTFNWSCQSPEEKMETLQERFAAIPQERDQVEEERQVIWTAMHNHPELKEYPGGVSIIAIEHTDRISSHGDNIIDNLLKGIAGGQLVATMIYEAKYPGVLKQIEVHMEPYLMQLEEKRNKLRTLEEEEQEIAISIYHLFKASDKGTTEEVLHMKRTLESQYGPIE